LQRLDNFDADAANTLLASMYEEAAAIVRRGAPDAGLSETRSALMRYRGQGHEIAVPLAAKTYRREDAGVIRGAFEDAYRRLYSRVIPGVEVEVLSWVVLVAAPTPVEAETPPAPPSAFAAPEARRRPVFDPDTGEFVEVGIYERPSLSPGATLKGPAVIVEDETSTVISRNFDARIDAFGYIELIRRGA
jgi:N-methylhydantoinase A